MNEEIFTKGQTVYDSLGNGYEFVAKAENYFIVKPICESYRGDESFEYVGSATVVSNIFSKPPIQQKSVEVDKLNNKLDELNNEINKKRNEMFNVTEQHEDLFKKFKKYEQLKYLENFIDGKFNYFVIENYHHMFSVCDKNDLESDGRYDNGLKLLSLFGDSNGDLSWKVNSYSSGCGSYETIYPFDTSEEAKQFALDKTYEYLLKKNKDGDEYWKNEEILKQANKVGISLKQEWLNYHKEQKEKNKQLAIEKFEKHLEKIKKGLIDPNQPTDLPCF